MDYNGLRYYLKQMFETIPGASATDATSLVGTSGTDSVSIINEAKKLLVEGVAGNDVIRFGQNPFVTSNHTYKGGAGMDVISGLDTGSALASSFINYNAGNDEGRLYDVATSTIKGGKGIDTINISSLTSSLLNGNKGNDLLYSSFSVSSSILGGKGSDTITILGSHDTSKIFGQLDDDTVVIGGGAGFLSSTINGNTGNDSISVGAIASFSTNSAINGGAGNDTVNASTSAVGITANGDAGNDIITGSTAADTLTGGADNDTLTAGAGIDTITGGVGNNNFIFGRALALTTDRDVITDGKSTDNYQLNTSTGGGLAAPFAALHTGDGTDFAATADGATTNSALATAVAVSTAGAVTLDADATVVQFTAAGGAGFAGGFGGLIAAQNAAFDLNENGGGNFTTGDQLLAVVEDTTDNQFEIGIVTLATTGLGVTDISAVSTIFEVSTSNGITSLALATAVDFIGLA